MAALLELLDVRQTVVIRIAARVVDRGIQSEERLPLIRHAVAVAIVRGVVRLGGGLIAGGFHRGLRGRGILRRRILIRGIL